MITDIDELTLKLTVSNAKVQNILSKILEIRKIEKKLELLLKQELKVSDELADNLRLELVCMEAYNAANSGKGTVCVKK